MVEDRIIGKRTVVVKDEVLCGICFRKKFIEGAFVLEHFLEAGDFRDQKSLNPRVSAKSQNTSAISVLSGASFFTILLLNSTSKARAAGVSRSSSISEANSFLVF